MRRESYARFCERLEVKSLRPTHPKIPVLANGRADDEGRIWTYVCDGRPFGGQGPPAALFCASREGGVVSQGAAPSRLYGASPAD